MIEGVSSLQLKNDVQMIHVSADGIYAERAGDQMPCHLYKGPGATVSNTKPLHPIAYSQTFP